MTITVKKYMKNTKYGPNNDELIKNAIRIISKIIFVNFAIFQLISSFEKNS